MIGTGVLAGGLYNLATTFRTTLRLDVRGGRLRYVRSPPFRRALVVEAGLTGLAGARIRRDQDSEGDPWYVLELHVAGSPPLFLAGAGQHGRAELERIGGLIGEARREATGAF